MKFWQYLVLPITKKTLLEGFEERVNPHDPIASPKGWHGEDSTTTSYVQFFPLTLTVLHPYLQRQQPVQFL
jgi:hypothetical protein